MLALLLGTTAAMRASWEKEKEDLECWARRSGEMRLAAVDWKTLAGKDMFEREGKCLALVQQVS